MTVNMFMSKSFNLFELPYKKPPEREAFLLYDATVAVMLGGAMQAV